jgi:hypothetical protein
MKKAAIRDPIITPREIRFDFLWSLFSYPRVSTTPWITFRNLTSR